MLSQPLQRQLKKDIKQQINNDQGVEIEDSLLYHWNKTVHKEQRG